MDLTFPIAIVLAVLALSAALIFVLRRGKKEAGPARLADSGDLAARLEKSRGGWIHRISEVLGSRSKIDDALYQDLEETLVTADVGVKTAHYLLENVRAQMDKKNLENPSALKDQLKQEILKVFNGQEPVGIPDGAPKPWVVMVIGVNGVGKTTTIGKLAAQFSSQGKKVMLAAGDTFRAAAAEQLTIWGERANVPVIAQKQGNDPSAVAFDAVSAACARDVDVLIIDTAGRLHTKVNLMEELKKVVRTIQKKLPEAPHEVWLVLDATTGQNALHQAKTFHESIGGITGIVLTKLDGTAKGGVLFSLVRELDVPVKFIGVGEKIEDLRPFEPKIFVDALFAE